MKTFIKQIDKCKDCPNVSYTHYDGEGESAPYQYNYPFCKIVSQLPRYKYDTQTGKSIPDKNTIPDWCPL